VAISRAGQEVRVRIIIGFDGSEMGEAALADLPTAALPTRAEALVLSVFDAWLPSEEPQAGPMRPHVMQLRARILEGVAKQRTVAERGAGMVRGLFPGWRVEATAVADSPAWAIIKRAEGVEGGVGGAPADLVVVGSHGYGGLKRFALGSVSQKVATQVHCSVRIARGRPGPAAARPLRIIVGVDGSAGGRAALEAVGARHWPAGTEVLLAAFEEPAMIGASVGPYAAWGVDPMSVGMAPTVQLSGEAIVADATAFLQRMPAAGSIAVTTFAKVGDPKYGIPALAEEWGGDGADCIFVGARGVRGIERLVLGSVSTAVAMNARCSVEIVHPRA
jgi:nucleotide-binding universal stress UspA family protein